MPKICLYLHLHQPFRLRELDLFEVGSMVGQVSNYFESQTENSNKEIFKKVAEKSYVPMLSLLLNLLEKHQAFCVSFSVSGVFLEQAQRYEPQVIALLQKLAKNSRVEFLTETYHHSLAALYSEQEFATQIKQHQVLVSELLGVTPTVFRNTELIYSNNIAQLVANLGFAGILTEGVDRYLNNRTKTQIFESVGEHPVPLLLKHSELSDDIAFRFSSKEWKEHPLTAEKYCRWLSDYGSEELINIFMDFETFGEHQWESTGIFDFFTAFVSHFNSQKHNQFILPSQALSAANKREAYDVPIPISWADTDRDLTAWTGNTLQKDTLKALYSLEEAVINSQDPQLLNHWRLLQTSDHFYYMCDKWFADGDVHAYFSPYDSPFEAYRRYSLALADLQERIFKKEKNPSVFSHF